MKKSGNNRQETPRLAMITILGWIYRPLLEIARRIGLPSTKKVNVTGASASVGTTVVACLGASATAAVGSYDWIRDLVQRPALASFRFFRFAEGGDLAYNGLERLPDVINCHPDRAIILLGEEAIGYIPSMSACTNASTPVWDAPSPASIFCRSIAMCSDRLSCAKVMMRLDDGVAGVFIAMACT
jgi:hypothetical protein